MIGDQNNQHHHHHHHHHSQKLGRSMSMGLGGGGGGGGGGWPSEQQQQHQQHQQHSQLHSVGVVGSSSVSSGSSSSGPGGDLHQLMKSLDIAEHMHVLSNRNLSLHQLLSMSEEEWRSLKLPVVSGKGREKNRKRKKNIWGR